MIEHIFIKNYKAFERENIPLDKHTMLIGTNSSGKTTVLEALDLFFNNHLRHDYIRDTDNDIVIEIHINEERYRKVYSPPDYYVNYQKCIGDMFAINYIKYLYIPKQIHNPKLLNDILSINLTQKVTHEQQSIIYKTNDYIDGILGNSNYSIFQTTLSYQMKMDKELPFTKEEYTTLLSNITYQYVIVGIDNVESNFDMDSLDAITKYAFQMIVTSNESDIVKQTNYYVSTLYKGNKDDDFDTIKKRLDHPENKVYLLVEGKYDVNWFETALELLEVSKLYTVIPCGGAGNIAFVKDQLEKEGYKTIVITDGDTKFNGALQRDVIELYADIEYINSKFHTTFKRLPTSKYTFFKAFTVKDDIVKNVLSRWAKKHLTKDNPFVREVGELLSL